MNNPSFEDRPHYGRDSYTQSIKGWYDCGYINFGGRETPPDIHQGNSRDTAFWDNTLNSKVGLTYLGMVVRENESYEAVSQRLPFPLKKGKCYTFSIYLARAKDYWSNATTLEGSRTDKKNFVKPAVLQIWGSDGFCDNRELLGVSAPVSNHQWEKFNFYIEPLSDCYFITLQAFYQTPVILPYNGNILLDGASAFELTECGQEKEILAMMEKKDKEVTQVKMPAHKANQKKTVTIERGTKQPKIDTIVASRPSKDKILTELDRSKIKQGQRIKIDRLYFAADSSSINVESYEVLNEVYEFLNGNPDIYVEIGGHTNGIPPHEFCDKLSEERARAVANYLIGKGIERYRVSYKGYGKRKPLASNRTDSGRKKNQRVEIKIISIG